MLTEFTKLENGNLKIALTEEGEIERDEIQSGQWSVSDAMKDIAGWIECELGNGWDWLRPEEIGALTEAPILSDDVERDDNGDLTYVGRVYWYPQYEVSDPLEKLLRDGSVIFTGAD